MPYENGLIAIGLALAVVFGTFVYALINARTVMALFSPVSKDEIVPGCGRQGSKAAALAALVLHFLAHCRPGLAKLAGRHPLMQPANGDFRLSGASSVFKRSPVRLLTIINCLCLLHNCCIVRRSFNTEPVQSEELRGLFWKRSAWRSDPLARCPLSPRDRTSGEN